jgi:uncharacterized protein YchJ
MDEDVRVRPDPNEPCPCGSGLSYGECCGRDEAATSAFEGGNA